MKLKLHTQVFIAMAAGVALGLVFQLAVPGAPDAGTTFAAPDDGGAGAMVAQLSPHTAAKGDLSVGDVVVKVTRNRAERGAWRPIIDAASAADLVARAEVGDVLWFETRSGREKSAPVILDENSTRGKLIAPFGFAADIFLALLMMLIVPLVLLSIISGVAGLTSGTELRRLGTKAFAYYSVSSVVAIVVGQLMVNLFAPGEGAELGLPPVGAAGVAPEASFIGVLKRMVAKNVFAAIGDNGAMLQVIFFGLIFGYFITKTASPHRERVSETIEGFLAVTMRWAQGVMTLIPLGVFFLLVKVVALTGTAVFGPLLLYMLTVVLALFVHAAVTLPTALIVLGKQNPWAWVKAMTPALFTAFSTSSSSMTLPVTMETVQDRGGVSKKISAFTLPLGATINMDGTALYECIGVIFLAQYYASVGQFELTLADQGLVVVMALVASIGAAGIPSAGLVMMLTILAALGLPLEGAALLLAVDRPLDMLRTTVNVWSDTCAAAVIARSEGETLLGAAVGAGPTP